MNTWNNSVFKKKTFLDNVSYRTNWKQIDFWQEIVGQSSKIKLSDSKWWHSTGVFEWNTETITGDQALYIIYEKYLIKKRFVSFVSLYLCDNLSLFVPIQTSIDKHRVNVFFSSIYIISGKWEIKYHINRVMINRVIPKKIAPIGTC